MFIIQVKRKMEFAGSNSKLKKKTSTVRYSFLLVMTCLSIIGKIRACARAHPDKEHGEEENQVS